MKRHFKERPHPSTKFRGNPSNSFCVILKTNQKTDSGEPITPSNNNHGKKEIAGDCLCMFQEIVTGGVPPNSDFAFYSTGFFQSHAGLLPNWDMAPSDHTAPPTTCKAFFSNANQCWGSLCAPIWRPFKQHMCSTWHLLRTDACGPWVCLFVSVVIRRHTKHIPLLPMITTQPPPNFFPLPLTTITPPCPPLLLDLFYSSWGNV